MQCTVYVATFQPLGNEANLFAVAKVINRREEYDLQLPIETL